MLHTKKEKETGRYIIRSGIDKSCPGFNRVQVPSAIMKERGFDHCDWISFGKNWNIWKQIFTSEEIELHVPCRDPLDHLMSQCNYNHRQKFDCSAGVDIASQVKRCLVAESRFNMRLTSLFDVKCFPVKPVEAYVNYMSQTLRQKRHVRKYVFRPTNRPRNKSEECIWAFTRLQEDIRQYLVSTFDYYKFCDRCMTSDQRLFA